MRLSKDREGECALCVKKLSMFAKRVKVFSELGALKLREEDAGIAERKEEVKVHRGCSMASRGGFGGVASPPP